MKDKNGYDIRCVNSEWRIYDARDNKDYICLHFEGWHHCYCDENCRYYKPIKTDEEAEATR